MSWVTEAQALDLTGVAVTEQQITLAQGVIDLYSGVTEDVEDLHPRDQRLLLQATAYQAVWMAAQVDPLTRTAVSRIEQDGVIVLPSEPDDLTLGPLAKLALSQLSWARRNRSRTVRRSRPTYDTFDQYAAAWLRDADECSHGWQPL